MHLGIVKPEAQLLLALMTTWKKEHLCPGLKEQLSTLVSSGCAGGGGVKKAQEICLHSQCALSFPPTLLTILTRLLLFSV